MSDTVNVPLSEYVGLLRENDALKAEVERLKERQKKLTDIDAVAINSALDSDLKAKAKIKKLKEVLKRLLKTTEGDCRLDHHGNCQTHGLNNPCEVALARKILQECEE